MNTSQHMTPRDRMRQDTRRRLVEAGTRALASRGLDGIKTAAVARDAGVANGTFYLHFEDREALVSAVVVEAVTELAQLLREIRHRPLDLRVADRLAMDAIVGWAEDRRDLLLGAIRGAWSVAGSEVITALIAQREAELRGFQALGEVRRDLDVRVMARAEFAMLSQTLSWWLIEDTGVSRQDLIDTLVTMTREGIGSVE